MTTPNGYLQLSAALAAYVEEPHRDGDFGTDRLDDIALKLAVLLEDAAEIAKRADQDDKRAALSKAAELCDQVRDMLTPWLEPHDEHKAERWRRMQEDCPGRW